jgi:hypothetical protein
MIELLSPLEYDFTPERTGMAQVDFTPAKIDFFEIIVLMMMKPRHP